eukprot:TRINITY_DN15410_c0_g1_i1.p1 TRINITY_DN15410_c0_g1~~TRINITY_DN15410_c0_g1_i1.p1  ORF type:complete len:408 (+),score=57.31 TRINITY_DN15410_c0_g1_i1:3-1226(+)
MWQWNTQLAGGSGASCLIPRTFHRLAAPSSSLSLGSGWVVAVRSNSAWMVAQQHSPAPLGRRHLSTAIPYQQPSQASASSFKPVNTCATLLHTLSDAPVTTFDAMLLGEQILVHGRSQTNTHARMIEADEGGRLRWNARLESRLLLASALGNIKQTDLLSRRSVLLSPPERDAFLRNLNKRREGMPISYVTGTKEFWGMEFQVNPEVLIPRPDSETLIETCLELYTNGQRPTHILDLGTGSGCLLIALLHEFPKAKGIGTDICADSLVVARRNQAKLVKSPERCVFVECDWLTEPHKIKQDIETTFELVVSNPPYVPDGQATPGTASFEPARALFGGSDGLAMFRRLATSPELPAMMRKGSHLVLEIGIGQAEPVRDMFAATSSALRFKQCTRDLGGIERCLVFEYV